MLRKDHLYSFSTACEGPPQLAHCTKLLEISTDQISCIFPHGMQTWLHGRSLGIVEGCMFIVKTSESCQHQHCGSKSWEPPDGALQGTQALLLPGCIIHERTGPRFWGTSLGFSGGMICQCEERSVAKTLSDTEILLVVTFVWVCGSYSCQKTVDCTATSRMWGCPNLYVDVKAQLVALAQTRATCHLPAS